MICALIFVLYNLIVKNYIFLFQNLFVYRYSYVRLLCYIPCLFCPLSIFHISFTLHFIISYYIYPFYTLIGGLYIVAWLVCELYIFKNM